MLFHLFQFHKSVVKVMKCKGGRERYLYLLADIKDGENRFIMYMQQKFILKRSTYL